MQAYQLQLLQQMQSTYGLKVNHFTYLLFSVLNIFFLLQPQDQEMMMLMQAQVAQVQAQQHQQEVSRLLWNTSRPTSESSSKELILGFKLNQTWTRPDLDFT